MVKPKIGLKIGFFCDINAPDDNTAIIATLKQAIRQGFPFITTRSLLKCTGVNDNMRTQAQDVETLF